MRKFLAPIASLLNRVCVTALWLSGICLVAMTVVIAYQVFGRYVLNATPSWAEALSISLMGWFIFLGAAVGVHEKTHLGFDVLLYVLPKPLKFVAHLISDIAVLAFGIGMVWFGIELARATWDATRPTLGIPDGVRYIPLALGGLLIVLFKLRATVARLAGVEEDSDALTPHSAGA